MGESVDGPEPVSAYDDSTILALANCSFICSILVMS